MNKIMIIVVIIVIVMVVVIRVVLTILMQSGTWGYWIVERNQCLILHNSCFNF